MFTEKWYVELCNRWEETRKVVGREETWGMRLGRWLGGRRAVVREGGSRGE